MDPRPDAVYIDPMFPPKRKTSALPPRSIRLVRVVVGDDEDAADLLQVALATAAKRVVVKRPNHAPPLLDNPVASYKGKLARFDVYPA
jgi:16S rRNA (guanine1516-N2)-methyltransferase